MYERIKKKIYETWTRFKRWIIFGVLGTSVIIAATVPITPEQAKWKTFTDNLTAIEYSKMGNVSVKGIWKPTETEFEGVYEYTYGTELVAWQKIDGTEMCPRIVREDGSLGGYTACIFHWLQEFNNAKERGTILGNPLKGLRNGVRRNQVNSDVYNPNLITKNKFDLRYFLARLVNRVFAAVEFEDHFERTTDITLPDHTPDTTGTRWTLFNASCDLFVDSVKDNLDAAESVTSGGCGNGEGALVTADDVPTNSDYTVSVTQTNGDTGDDTNTICSRLQDGNNMYCLLFNEGGGGPQGDLYSKTTASGWTIIEANCGHIADGSKVELIVTGTTISVEDDDIEICSVTNSDHSAAGKAAIGMGDTGGPRPNDDVQAQELDDFIIDVIVTLGTGGVPKLFLKGNAFIKGKAFVK